MSLLLRSPNSMDIAIVAHQLLKSDVEQIEALTGAPYDADAVTARCLRYSGPKWAIVNARDNMPLAVAGCIRLRPHVYQTWFLSMPELWVHGKKVTEVTRKVMLEMLADDAHRIETLCLASRKEARSWYDAVGLHFEAEFLSYGANGEAFVQYAIHRTPEK